MERNIERSIDGQIDRNIEREREREYVVDVAAGCMVVVLLLLLMTLYSSPASHCNTSRDHAAPYATVSRIRLRCFSDSTSCLLLLYPFVLAVSLSNLALAVADAFRKSLVALAFTRYARKKT
jgi:hypothetical protein